MLDFAHIEQRMQSPFTAEAVALNLAKKHLDCFGFVKFGSYFSHEAANAIRSDIEQVCKAEHGFCGGGTISFVAPLENSSSLQRRVVTSKMGQLLHGVIGEFIYSTSDGCMKADEFGLHRDTFLNPPLYKIFIAVSEGRFRFLPGTHWNHDNYAKMAGSITVTWDSGIGKVEPAIGTVIVNPQIEELKIEGGVTAVQETPDYSIHLQVGDILVFNQNLIHGLVAINKNEGNTFVAFSVFPAPVQCRSYGFDKRSAMAKEIIKSRVAIISIDKKEITLGRDIQGYTFQTGYSFGEEAISKLKQVPGWKHAFWFEGVDERDIETARQSLGCGIEHHLRDLL